MQCLRGFVRVYWWPRRFNQLIKACIIDTFPQPGIDIGDRIGIKVQRDPQIIRNLTPATVRSQPRQDLRG